MDFERDKDKDFLEKIFPSENFSEEELNKRQWQILEAAIKVFSEKGFGSSRTSEIAKEADVAEGTIFRYYKTKKDLLMGLLIPLITRIFRPLVLKSVERIVKNEENKTIDEVVKDVYIDRFSLIEKNFPLIKTIFIESIYHPELLENIQKNLAPNVIPFINDFAKENIKKENFRNVEPMLITKTMMSLLIGHIILTKTFPEFFKAEGDNEGDIEKMVDVLLHGVGNNQK